MYKRQVRYYLKSAAIFYPNWDQEYADRLLNEFQLEPKKKISQLSKGQMSMAVSYTHLDVYKRQALGDVNGDIQEIIEGLKVVKAFTHEEQAKEDFRKLNTAYRDAAQKANFYSIMIMPVSGNLMNISYALTAAFGGLLSVLQGFDLGGLVVYLNYSKQVGQPLNQISMCMKMTIQGKKNL